MQPSIILSAKTVLFLGSSDFAVPSLQALCALGFHPIVVTKPDKPAGRGKKLRSTPVKTTALQAGLTVLEWETLQQPAAIREISDKKPDLLVSSAYGNYIPPELLRFPSVNVHPSLLPKYRGAAPVERALMAGESITGVTLAKITEEWDAGDVLLQKSCPIDPEENAGMLREKLAQVSALLLQEAIPRWFSGNLPATPQDHEKKSAAPKIKEEETWIRWREPAFRIHNQIRALAPHPGARTTFHQSPVKILESHPIRKTGSAGTILQLEKEGPIVGAGEEALLLLQIQPANRKTLSGKDFLNGYRPNLGETFES